MVILFVVGRFMEVAHLVIVDRSGICSDYPRADWGRSLGDAYEWLDEVILLVIGVIGDGDWTSFYLHF
jgi:hypothetical protein